jgi:hypothetical protein
VKLTTNLQLVPRSRKCGSIHTLPPYAFMALCLISNLLPRFMTFRICLNAPFCCPPIWYLWLISWALLRSCQTTFTQHIDLPCYGSAFLSVVLFSYHNFPLLSYVSRGSLPFINETQNEIQYFIWYMFRLHSSCINWINLYSFHLTVARRSVVGWGTMLQAGMSRIRFPMRSWDFSVYLTLPHYGPGVDSVSNRY